MSTSSFLSPTEVSCQEDRARWAHALHGLQGSGQRPLSPRSPSTILCTKHPALVCPSLLRRVYVCLASQTGLCGGEGPPTPPAAPQACSGTLPSGAPTLGRVPFTGPSSWDPQVRAFSPPLMPSHRPQRPSLGLTGPTPALCCLPSETPAGQLHPFPPALPLPPHPWTTCLSSALARSPARAWQEGKAVTKQSCD